MKIEQISELSLTADDDRQIGVLLEKAFGGKSGSGFGGRSYYKQRHHLRILVRDQEKVLGHIALLFRVIRVDKTFVPVVGLAEVATHPAHAGQGIASALLKRAIAHSQDSLANFIVLFGDHPIYAKHGFQSMKNPLRYVVMGGGQTNDIVTRIEDTLMVLPLKGVIWDTEAKVDLMGYLF